MKISEYKVVVRGNAHDLSCDVETAILAGWRPLGGVGVGKMLYQALVREVAEEADSVDDLVSATKFTTGPVEWS